MRQFFPNQCQFSHEIEVKRSRFITYIVHTPDKQSSDSFIRSIQELHPKANHNCWARIAGLRENLTCRQSSDDGEPKGTAGKPMLNVLEHSDLCEVTVVVTRYFGGIKLGAGGLVRAYSQAVQEAIQLLPITEYVPTIAFSIRLPFDLISDVEHMVANSEVTILDRQWESDLTLNGEGSQEQLISLEKNLNPLLHLIHFASEKPPS